MMDQIDMICEEHDRLRSVLKDIYDDLLSGYQSLSGEEQRAFDMGEMYGKAALALKWSKPACITTPESEGRETDDECR